MRFDEIINKIVIQDGGPDAILNIPVIQKTTFHENITLHEWSCMKQTSKFSAFYVLRFDEIINKTVIQDSGRTPSWIFQSFQKLHSRKYKPTWMTHKKQTSKILTCYNEIWRKYQQNSNPRWWSDAILNYKSLSHMLECTHGFSKHWLHSGSNDI